MGLWNLSPNICRIVVGDMTLTEWEASLIILRKPPASARYSAAGIPNKPITVSTERSFRFIVNRHDHKLSDECFGHPGYLVLCEVSTN